MNVLSPWRTESRDRGDRGEREGIRWPLIIIGVLVVLLVSAGVVAVWVQRQVNPSGAPGDVVTVTVAEGMSVDDIGDLLERQGVITSATVFRYYARIQGAPTVLAGDYDLHRRESLGTVLDVLAGGPKVELERLTVPEGLTLAQIAEVVGELPGRSAAKFLEAARSGRVRSRYQPSGSKSLEGLVLPETYFIDKGDDEEAILRRMVREFDDLVTRLGITGAASRLRVTPYELVVVASLVEREARVADDRGKIARVIYNRLEAGMPLQIDATVQFALGTNKARLLYSDLEVDSPYNTYKVTGLPPGPIASPGSAALEAALNPPAGKWLFFVLADFDGRHAFAVTLAEHNRNTAEAVRKGVL